MPELISSQHSHSEGTQCASTPLHAACQGGHVGLAKLLIDRGAYVDAVDQVREKRLASTRGS